MLGPRRGARAAIGVIALVAMAFLLTTLGVFAPRAAAAGWVGQVAAVPPEPNGELTAVSCPTSQWCAAVGSFTDRSYRVRPLFETFNRRRWRRARSTDWPDFSAPPSTASGSFRAVSCASSVACVAVGSTGYNPRTSGFSTLAARWNGRTWSAMPAPAGYVTDAVSCVSKRVCVAVGEGAARWDGRRWTAEWVPDPSGLGVRLTSVSCPGPKECLAAGEADASGNGVGVLERWDGTRWSVVGAPLGEDSGLDSSSATVSCASASRCVAIVRQATYANSSDSGTSSWFADVWNGHIWSTRSAPAAQSISCVTGLCATVGDGPPAVLERRGWHIDRSARSPQFQTSVSCANARRCVGVGAAPPPGPPQTGVLVTTPAGIRWNGSRWSRATPAAGAGSQPSELRGIACASAQACMAVGVIYSNAAATPLSETWTGRGWRLASPPVPTGGGVLESVSCISPHDCVAVGYSLAGVPNGLGRGALVEAWNGSWWSSQPTPPLAGQVELHSVSCTSPTNCVAVGLQSPLLDQIRQPLIERWNGAGWTIDQQASTYAPCGTGCVDPSRTLAAVACASALACEAVGSTSTNQSTTTFAESWNGTDWTTTPTANPARAPLDNALTAVSCTTPTACVAIGSGGPGWGQNNMFAERWDGTGWSVQGTSPGPVAAPRGISCTAASHCEIVGVRPASNNAPARPQAWLWNGLTWSAENPPGLPNASLESVACPTASDCFAVGATSTEPGPTTYPLTAPFIERFG